MEKEKSEYDLKAEQFLKDTNTTFKTKFLKNDLYFPEDEETRDIYNITLERKDKGIKWVFRFGQSIKNSDGKTNPSIYDVLAGLTKYNPETFEDFCSSYGYDTDSRKAEKTYKAVVKEWVNVENLWTTEEIEKLQEIN